MCERRGTGRCSNGKVATNRFYDTMPNRSRRCALGRADCVSLASPKRFVIWSQVLVQEHRSVERIALEWLEACIANHLSHLLLGRCICAFDKHHAACVVGSEA